MLVRECNKDVSWVLYVIYQQAEKKFVLFEFKLFFEYL